MKIVHLSNNLIPGGAGKAARTINEALQKAGMDSSRLDIPNNTFWQRGMNTFRAYYDKLPLQRYPRNPKTAFSTANIGMGTDALKALEHADLIHLHWVHQGYIGFKEMEFIASLNKKIYINMHDSWWISGGCNVTHGCNQWQNGCGRCPQLNSTINNDLSSKLFSTKRAILKKLNPIIICASTWMYERASTAPMFSGFKIARIPYAIDLEKYHPVNKVEARTALGLPLDKKLILFGSVDLNDPNKGFSYFRSAINELPEEDESEIVIFGNLPNGDLNISKKIHALGLLHDEALLAKAYSAADIFVAPSLEDNFPNTVLESITCGTPVVAFNIGGMPDMITHLENGFLAEAKNVHQLMLGISKCLTDTGKMSTFARKKSEDAFRFDIIAQNYTKLYQ